MPPIRFLASNYSTHYFKLIAVILSLNKIMPIYSHYTKKKLVYITITAPFSYQPSFCSEYTKLNIHSFYNIQLVSITKYIFLVFIVLFYLPHSLGTNT